MKRVPGFAYFSRRPAGQAMVEFALILPLVALLLFGIIQYGLIFNASMTLRHGAHYAARRAALPGADLSSDAVKTDVCSVITPLLDCNRLQSPVVTTNALVDNVRAVTVSLTYSMPILIPFVVPQASGGTLTMHSSATFRRE